MANNCFFNARLIGKGDVVDKVSEWIKNHTYDSCEFVESAGPPISDKILTDFEHDTDICIYGDVKWSVLSAWNLDKKNPKSPYNIDSATSEIMKKTLQNLENKRVHGESLLDFTEGYMIEIYSEESGMGFQEHYIIKNGEVLVDDCRHWSEGYNEDTDESYPVGGFKEFISDFNPDKIIPEWDGTEKLD